MVNILKFDVPYMKKYTKILNFYYKIVYNYQAGVWALLLDAVDYFINCNLVLISILFQ